MGAQLDTELARPHSPPAGAAGRPLRYQGWESCLYGVLRPALSPSRPARGRGPVCPKLGRALLHDDLGLHEGMKRADVVVGPGLGEGEGELVVGIQTRRLEALRL